MTKRYYEVTDTDLKKNLKKELKLHKGIYKKMLQYSESIGASPKAVVTSDSLYGMQLIGFVFSIEAEHRLNPKHWKCIDTYQHWWKPKKTNKDVYKAVDELRSDVRNNINKLIGLGNTNPFAPHSVGIEEKKGRIFLIVNGTTKKPKGCERISDIQFETLFPRHKD